MSAGQIKRGAEARAASIGKIQCAAQIPDAGQTNVLDPILKRCSYRARPGSPLCSIHSKKFNQPKDQPK